LNLALPSRTADRLGFREGLLALDREFVHPHGAEPMHRAGRSKGPDRVEPAYWSRGEKRPGMRDRAPGVCSGEPGGWATRSRFMSLATHPPGSLANGLPPREQEPPHSRGPIQCAVTWVRCGEAWVSRRSHTPMRTRRSPRNLPETRCGGLSPRLRFTLTGCPSSDVAKCLPSAEFGPNRGKG
jgi:hypothetical protein